MGVSFFEISREEQRALIVLAEERLGLPDYIIEKDLWLCWVLEQLFMLPLKMAFKGGTSLSKVYGLISRFSEDVDITIDYRNFVDEIDFEHVSRSQVKKISKDLKAELKILAETKILTHLKERSASVFSKGMVDIKLSEDGECLRFYYPSLKTREFGYLRDHVLIEFGIRNSSEPFEDHNVHSYLAEVIDGSISLPNPNIKVLSPIRTFWEKATLIHVECNRKRLTESPERLSRHWYDLHMLNKSWVGEKALIEKQILEDVVDHKTAFFNASYAHYDRCLRGEFRLIPDVEDRSSLEKDYKEMVAAGMFHKGYPSFDELIETLQRLEGKLNRIYS